MIKRVCSRLAPMASILLLCGWYGGELGISESQNDALSFQQLAGWVSSRSFLLTLQLSEQSLPTLKDQLSRHGRNILAPWSVISRGSMGSCILVHFFLQCNTLQTFFILTTREILSALAVPSTLLCLIDQSTSIQSLYIQMCVKEYMKNADD